MNLELDLFRKDELIRACRLIGIKNEDDLFETTSEYVLRSMILKKINPDGKSVREQFEATMDLFKIEYNKDASDEEYRKLLYEYNAKKLEKAIAKMSSKKKKKLQDQLESTLDKTVIEELKKTGSKGVAAGAGIGAIQLGAIAVTGTNLGICALLTTGLSGLSGVIGVTFPFAAYTTAASVGGSMIAVGGFLTAPWVMIPVLGMSGYLIYKNLKNKQYINLAGINYLIESHKKINQFQSKIKKSA